MPIQTKYRNTKTASSRYKALVGTLVMVIVASWGYAFTNLSGDSEMVATGLHDLAAAAALPYRAVKLSRKPADKELLVPVEGVTTDEIADTWGAARSGGRAHEGIDIFAPHGTPVYSATDGYVLFVGKGALGGNYVFTIGAGGVRYYYAHLDEVAKKIKPGKKITTETVLGYVGNTGNAVATPPHLHFGMYTKKGPRNPFAMFVDRSENADDES